MLDFSLSFFLTRQFAHIVVLGTFILNERLLVKFAKGIIILFGQKCFGKNFFHLRASVEQINFLFVLKELRRRENLQVRFYSDSENKDKEMSKYGFVKRASQGNYFGVVYLRNHFTLSLKKRMCVHGTHL